MLQREIPEGLSLSEGGHESPEEGMCAMELVSWLAGEEFSDRPKCTCPVIGTFMRGWNDGIESDDKRNCLLLDLVPRVIGTRDPGKELARSWLALDWLIRTHACSFMELTDSLKGHADALRKLPPIGSHESLRAAEMVLYAARDAVGDAARVAAWDAAGSAAWNAARAAAGSAAWNAARAAAGAAAWNAAGSAAWNAARAAAGAAAWNAAGAAARAAAWNAARAAAWNAAGGGAWDAARVALAPTVAKLQLSAKDLVIRMVEV